MIALSPPSSADVTTEYEYYEGPVSKFDKMEAGFTIEELGLTLMIGPSISGKGRGLFVALNEDVEVSKLTKGTVICGYSRGVFSQEAEGDKTVGFNFNSVNNTILFEKQLLPIYEVAYQLLEEKRVSDTANSIIGHIINYNEEAGVSIRPDENFLEFYFTPAKLSKDDPLFSISNVGSFANDLAYCDTTTKEVYEKDSQTKNALMLVWRMVLENGVLSPTWPVVILNKDLVFANVEPMEIGLMYSWKYWEAARKTEEMMQDYKYEGEY